MNSEISKMTRMEIIKDYAEKCVSGEIIACVKHKNACKRALRDFKRAETDDNYPYYWDEAAAELIVSWFKVPSLYVRVYPRPFPFLGGSGSSLIICEGISGFQLVIPGLSVFPRYM